MNFFEDAQFIKHLNVSLKNGGVIGFVTDTVWGIGCLAGNKKAVDKIYKIKNRDRDKPLILMSDKLEKLTPYLKYFSKKVNELAKEHLPGALTIVAEKSDLTPDFITAGKNTVGIRIPDNLTFQKLCSIIEGGVLATTSANYSTEKSAKTYEETAKTVGKDLDIIIEDFGCCARGIESTVVLVECEKVKILRQGAIEVK